MDRDSFLFYKSFYEAIVDLPNDIKLETLTAVIEYALFDKIPDDLKPVTKGLFTLMKPNVDVNIARRENGKKGAKYGKRGGRPKKQPTTPGPEYNLTYEQEIERMRADETWRATICQDFSITHDEYGKRLSRFLSRCNDDKERKGKQGHDSLADCQSHLRYWMTKAYPQSPASNEAIDSNPPFPTSDYTFKGGFGGIDT